MTEINHQREIKKLQDKIITLQDLIINKDKYFELASKESAKYCLELLEESTKKSNKISHLEHENFAIKAAVAREWEVPLEEAEKRLVDKTNKIKLELGID